jgi:hypothetical protein
MKTPHQIREEIAQLESQDASHWQIHELREMLKVTELFERFEIATPSADDFAGIGAAHRARMVVNLIQAKVRQYDVAVISGTHDVIARMGHARAAAQTLAKITVLLAELTDLVQAPRLLTLTNVDAARDGHKLMLDIGATYDSADEWLRDALQYGAERAHELRAERDAAKLNNASSLRRVTLMGMQAA